MPRKDRASRNLRAPKATTKSATAVAPLEQGKSSASAEDSPARPAASWRGWYAIIPPALAIMASINTLWNGFASDDLAQVLNNTFIKDFSNVPLVFTSSVWSFMPDIIFSADLYYRPIFNLLLTINYSAFGTAAWGWHLVNVLIHCAVTLLTFLVVKEMTDRRWLAAVAASLFAVHPAHAESVAWVSGVTDPLMALFLLPAFYFYLKYRKLNRPRLLIVALLFYFLALLSKETALALPLFIAYCELFHFEPSRALKERIIRLLALAGWFAVPIALYFLMRYNALGVILFGGDARYPLVPALLTVPLTTVKYLALMFVPWGYSYQHYTEFVSTVRSVSFIAPFALLAIITALVALTRSRLLALGAVWFAVMLAPAVAALRQFEPAYLVQERYLYLPSIGIYLAVALGIEWLAAQRWFGTRGREAAVAVAVVVIVVLTAAHIKQNRVWQDNLSLHKNIAAVNPHSSMAHAVLARAYFETGRFREAEASIRTALDLNSQNTTAHLNLSYFAHTSGKLDKAIEQLETAAATVSAGPMTRYDLGTIYLNLGLLYAQQKRLDRAEESMLKSEEIWSRPVVWYHLGQFYFKNGRYQEALALFERTSARVPSSFAHIHLAIAQTHERMGNREQARAAYERFLQSAPPGDTSREGVIQHLNQSGEAAQPQRR